MTKKVTLTLITDDAARTTTKSQSKAMVGWMKTSISCTVVELTPEELAQKLKENYAFFPQVHALNVIGPKGYATISGKSFIKSELFSVDIDHANYSLKQLEAVLEANNIKPLIIYKTQSSNTEGKGNRWRIVLHLDRFITDEDEYAEAINYVMYLFIKDCDHTKVKADTSGKDTARISYTAKNRSKINVYEAGVNSVDALVRLAKETNSTAKLKEFADIYKAHNEEEKPKTVKKTRKTKSKAVKLSDDIETLAERVEMNLRKLGKDKTLNLPESVDTSEAQLMINLLPLDRILGVKKETAFNCIFHDDKTPSAFIHDDNGQTWYKCFGCDVAHTTFFTVAYILNSVYNENMYQLEKRICGLLGVKHGTEYQQRVAELMDTNKEFIFRGLMNKDNELIELLAKNNCIHLLDALYSLAKMKCPTTPFTFVEDLDGLYDAHIVVSQPYLHQMMNRLGVEGYKSRDTLIDNLKLLQMIGLVNLTPYEGLTEETLQWVNEMNNKTRLLYVNDFNRKIIESELQVKLLDEESTNLTEISCYHLTRLTPRRMREALDTLKKLMGWHVSKRHATRKVIQLLNKEVADAVFNENTKTKYTKGEIKFIKDSLALADSLLEHQGYFTKYDIIDNVDKSRSVIKSKKEKEKLFSRYQSVLVKEKNLKRCKVSSANRAKYNVSSSVKLNSNDYIYVTK